MVVIDEHGEQWEVLKGDPAYDAMMRLRKIGFKTIMLPLAVLMAKPNLEWPTIDHLRKLDGEAFLRYASLLDQAEALANTNLYVKVRVAT